MAARKIGRYAVFGELAAGGMATVYVGRLTGAAGFSRRVAIKSLHAQYAKDPDFLAMFLDEARLSGRVQHPNVVQILDVISTTTELHLAMEYVEGESLSKLIRGLRASGERVPLAVAVAILIGVLEGLHAAHEARAENGQALCIVHRDVSPQNVLVGVDGVPRILDFGIAKAVGRMQTTRGDQLKGKLAYMAPEHLAREPLDRRADVYAAGIVLWELLTGERLFQADDEISTFRRALEAKVPPPGSLAPEVTPALDAAVLRALAKKPEARYQTARELACDLEATGLAASTRDLAAWVQKKAATALAERATRIADYEAALGSNPSYSLEPEPEDSARHAVPSALTDRLRAEHADTAVLQQPPQASRAAAASPLGAQRTRRSKGLALAILTLLVLGATAVSAAWLGRAPSAAVPSPDRTPARAALEPPAAAAEPLPAPSAAATTPTSSPAPMAEKPIRGAARERATSGAGAKKAKPNACETPFTVDARGVRVPKLQCL